MLRLVFRSLLLWLVPSLVPCAALASSPRHEFGLNDVSVLLPLPRSEAEATRLLSARQMIPDRYLKALPRLIIDDTNPAERLEQLRVVAFRFDPCFVEGATPVSCRKQIRLIFQPVSKYQNFWLTIDAAVHAFYDFSDDDWSTLMQEWRGLTRGTRSEALQVHPVIKREGLEGAHWAALRSLLERHCKSTRLTRLTVSAVNAFGTQWDFSGFDISGDQLDRIMIARLGRPKQIFFGDLGNLKEFFGDLSPAPAGEPAWMQVLQHSIGALNHLSEPELLGVVQRAVEIENPTKFNPGTMDCASCHVAQNVRRWGESHLSKVSIDAGVRGAWFTAAGWNLSNATQEAYLTNRVRAFGYFNDEAVISQRVINESAAVAESL